MLKGPDQLTINRFVFDSWWTDAYVDKCIGLTPDEIDALVSYHWTQLQAVAIRDAMRGVKAND